MRLRLTAFEGLRINLAPGWYELPSHVPTAERRRLLDLLGATVPGIHNVIECAWTELDMIEAGVGAETIIHVSVPGSVTAAVRGQRWHGLRPRVGLYSVQIPGRWPEPSWDEREVKSSLAAWLRRSLADPKHPLAALGVTELPLDQLIAATSEPIELLELVELSISHASRTLASGQPVDWQRVLAWSLARRLGRRLDGVEPGLRAPLLRIITAAIDGQLPAVDAEELGQLTRVGLAYESAHEGFLVPLARRAADPDVRDALERQGMFVSIPRASGVPSRRARTVAEAVLAFEPRARVDPEDPRFVDLREQLPWVREFARRFVALLEPDEGLVRLAVLQQPRSGADTMIRRLLHELRASHGIVTVAVTGLGALDEDVHPADLWLAMLRSLLEWVAAEGEPWLPVELFERLRAWLAEQSMLEPAKDMWDLGAEVPDPNFVLACLRRLEDGQRAKAGRSELRGRTRELMWHLRRVVDELQWQLAARGSRLCLRVEGLTYPRQFRVEAALLGALDELSGLACNLVLSLSFVPELGGQPTPVSEQLATLTYAEAPGGSESPKEAMTAAARELLRARVEPAAVFEDEEAVLPLLADVGHVGEILELAWRACVEAGGRRVTTADVVGARALLASELRQRVPAMFSLGHVAVGQGLWRPEPWMLISDAITARADGGWIMHPLLQAGPEFLAIQLRAEGLLASDPELAIERLRQAVGLAGNSTIAGTLAHATLHGDLSDKLDTAGRRSEAIEQSVAALRVLGDVEGGVADEVLRDRVRTLHHYLTNAISKAETDEDAIVNAIDFVYRFEDALPDEDLLLELVEIARDYSDRIPPDEGELLPPSVRNAARIVATIERIVAKLCPTHPLRVAFELPRDGPVE